ncbi:transposase, partial [Streptomyces cellulosae]
MGSVERHKQVRAYRGLMPSPGRPSVAWREDRVRFWSAIARGAKTEDACSAAGVSGPAGFRWFRHAGGVNPCLADEASGRYLSFRERENIAVWHPLGAGVREIARRLGRAPSTVSRELRRNASTRTYKLDYRASTVQRHAERRARRPKTAKLVDNPRLRAYVQARLSGDVTDPGGNCVGPEGLLAWKGRNKPHRGDRDWVTAWSPEQIARRLPVEFPDDEDMRTSTATVLAVTAGQLGRWCGHGWGPCGRQAVGRR